MVEAARIAYRDYPTVVNEVPESGVTYNNTMAEYARMDSKMQSAQKAIGGSSDTAQICQSYYWDKLAKNQIDDETQQMYENTVILAVCAQLAIDGCKKVFSVDVNDDLKRIRSQKYMKRKMDYPRFIQYTRDIPMTKNGKERPYEDVKADKNKIKNRIDNTIICPMNWLEECLDKIQSSNKNNVIDTIDFFIKMDGTANHKQMSRVRKLIEEYDFYMRNNPNLFDTPEGIILLNEYHDNLLSTIRKFSINKNTMNRLIETSFGVDGRANTNKRYKNATKYTRKMLNMLYQYNPKQFLSNFRKG